MTTQLPRPVRTRLATVARVLRRRRKGFPAIRQAKRSERPSQAFNAALLPVPPVIAANATPSSD